MVAVSNRKNRVKNRKKGVTQTKKWYRSIIYIRLFNELNDGNNPAHADEKEIDRQHDVTEFKKLSLTNNNHIVLLSNVWCLLRQSFELDVLYKKFTKLLIARRT